MSTEAILSGLNERGVRYVVVGGIAAVAHGSAYQTNDIDICYEPSPDNRERLAGLLLEWHAYPCGVEPGLPFHPDARALRAGQVFTLVTDRGRLDVMTDVSGIGGFDRVVAASQETVVLGVRTRILTLDALITAKRAANRVKDHPHIVELEALREKLRGGGPPAVKEATRRPGPRRARRRA